MNEYSKFSDEQLEKLLAETKTHWNEFQIISTKRELFDNEKAEQTALAMEASRIEIEIARRKREKEGIKQEPTISTPKPQIKPLEPTTSRDPSTTYNHEIAKGQTVGPTSWKAARQKAVERYLAASSFRKFIWKLTRQVKRFNQNDQNAIKFSDGYRETDPHIEAVYDELTASEDKLFGGSPISHVRPKTKVSISKAEEKTKVFDPSKQPSLSSHEQTIGSPAWRQARKSAVERYISASSFKRFMWKLTGQIKRFNQMDWKMSKEDEMNPESPLFDQYAEYEERLFGGKKR